MTILRGTVVLPESVVTDGVVVTEGDRITYAGPADAAPVTAEALAAAGSDIPADSLLMPGFVDVHNHGGGGASFPDAQSIDDVRTATLAHRNAGTTTLVGSMVTAPRDLLLARAELLAEASEQDILAGVHCEGPFLSYERRGAQSPENLLTGSASAVRDLVAAAGGHLRSMTVAPEIEGVAGADGAAAALVAAGVIPSIGHTTATTEQTEALIAAVVPGLREQGLSMTVTHLFNGMNPLHHRDPGVVAACLAAAERGEIVAELVADGVHLVPAMIRSMVALIGADNVAFVTDAMAAAGMPDGQYQLGPMLVNVVDGVAKIREESGYESIAGGTARLIDVIKTSVTGGVPLVDAVKAASWTPARAFGFTDVGGLVAGRRADVVVASADFAVSKVMRRGQWL
jgi:N-acetylglucosamine-6-phosphate deacetylase